ncbi:MAG: nucleoside triphosphate pyrophosphohydrolase [Candidatus Brocadiae bacterium]|nr:nucleoside triphosphate pyrophosphohydrolase [Candidatus Brocadiia bacterium]
MSRAAEALDRLLDVLRQLLAGGGCPWDRAQSPSTLRPFLLEETYEALEGLDADDPASVCEELGDLAYLILFLSELFSRRGAFDAADVLDGIAAKLRRRHPWVFGDATAASPEDALRQWERLKSLERDRRGASVLEGVPELLPALPQAFRLAAKAARVGFDWPDAASVFAKMAEETAELREAAQGGDPRRIEEEVGDLLFTAANLARKLDVDPESALRRTNAKFQKRFRHVETRLREMGKTPEQSTLEEMDALWNEAKSLG